MGDYLNEVWTILKSSLLPTPSEFAAILLYSVVIIIIFYILWLLHKHTGGN